MSTESPLLDTIADMTEASVERSSLSARELMMVRIGALAAVDAPVASYFLNMGVAVEEGITVEDAQGILVAVAPIIGAPKAIAAAASMAEAYGFAIAIDEAIQERQASA